MCIYTSVSRDNRPRRHWFFFKKGPTTFGPLLTAPYLGFQGCDFVYFSLFLKGQSSPHILKYLHHNPSHKKAQFLPLFNVNLYQPQLNSTSTQFQLNFDSTSFQPQPQINLSLNINLNSTSTLTSTQYGCDIKATKSCSHYYHF